MAFATIHYLSRSLRKASAFNIVFPEEPAAPRPWAAFYLLHGLSDDNTIWERRTSIERYVAGWPLVVVMPDGGRGFYTNAIDVKAERSGRAIGGLSMGGYGAIKLGLKHPERFASVNSHSGAVGFLRGDTKRAKEHYPEFDRVFGKALEDGPEDPFTIVKRIDHGRVPKLRIDCGTEDFLLDQNRSFHALLESLHIAHEYQEFPGGHDWAYWDRHVQEALAFHVKNLQIQRIGG
jgi:putative tributyrin esterase